MNRHSVRIVREESGAIMMFLLQNGQMTETFMAFVADTEFDAVERVLHTWHTISVISASEEQEMGADARRQWARVRGRLEN